MTWRFIPIISVACLFSSVSSLAQEVESIALGDGSSITIEEYLIERPEQGGAATVVVMARSNFDPEPFGAVPSDDFARRVQPLCAGLVQNSGETLEAENARYVRIRWDFKPSYDTGAPDWMEMSRFHEFLFVLDENGMCIPQPLGAGLDNLEPDLPSGLPVALRYIEPGPRARQLTLTYDVAEDLGEVTSEKLENAAIELCVLHADLVLEDRQQYYQHLETGLIAIAFAQSDGRGIELERRVLFGVKDGACDTGLSTALVDSIRGTVDATAAAAPASGNQQP